ncbi:TonB-dependent receptor [Bacteroides thetaiotaomicron]|uniref:SusC/RagA family TonB-linked outer membrane protein n=1 Tax=Bacteroides thetaiotaomicron TaxID=818 RepID=UPI001CE39576|nr:TonB-dependent receptor [Bacteroides thetaiotaomicron]MCA6054668.1 TonB-dependent receptor [Bacteroides thetaiotaomicron]
MMKNFLFICMLLLGLSTSALAQESIVVTGVVTDTNKEPMIGVNVSISNIPGLGAITDLNGKYSIKMPPYHKLVFTYIGFEKVEVLVKEQRTVNVTMKEASAREIDEVVITGTGAQKKLTVTGAITNVDVDVLKANPSGSMANALAGNVPGILAMQTSGKPGSVSEFWIRGISTFGASNSALVLVDGFERSLDEINVEDVESFSVLKDASATAIYGSKGANGVVLITTKHGKAGKINISAKAETFYNMLTQVPDFVDGYTYASMANEAKITRNLEPLYKADELEIFRLGLDPDLYPNVNWIDELLRKGSWSTRATLSMNGGGNTARYYVSGSYLDQQGMYKVDKALKDYNTNANFRRWNYRMNVDIDITKSTLLKVGVSGSLQKANDSGVGSDAIWTALMGYNAIMVPKLYSNGYVPAYGNDNGDRFNPWVQATMTGYRENWKNNIQTNVTLEQKLDFITKGLRFVGRFGYDTENNNWINRRKWPEQWKAKRFRATDGTLDYDRVAEERKMFQESGSDGLRNEFFEAELHYSRGFKHHHLGGTLKYNQSSKIKTVGLGDDLKQGIARRNQGLAGRFTYNWNYRYFIDFNFGYTGSENFAAGHRFGFFPAISGAWNIAEESLIKKHLKWMNMFKIRYSYGKVGNDNLGNTRFPYLYDIETMTKKDGDKTVDTGGYNFGDYTFDRYYGGMRYSSLSSPNVTWEIATKHDLGIDFSFFNDKLSGSVDYFNEKREGIYMLREYLPGIVGLESNPSANVGKVTSEGFDGHFTFRQKLGAVGLTIRSNITYSKNEVVDRDEENNYYWYKMQKGHRVNQARGLISLGLFKDYDDIRNSPVQDFDGYKVMPGDIKYKDVNGDGKIDGNDQVAIGATTKPNLIYGFGIAANWKGLDVNLHFQGAGKSTYFIDGSTVHMFKLGDGWGNVLSEMANSNRWISADISGDPATENPNAEYPRLSYGPNSNNYQQSTYWLRNGSYLRLKTVEVGYTLPTQLVNKVHFNTVRIFFVGTNLLTWSAFKLWDPEMGSTDGKRYPLSKNLSLGISVNL